MKTRIYTTVISTFAAIIFALNVNATEFNFEEEPYIDDIPFDTEIVCDQIWIKNVLECFCLEEEAYIDDIPFDTKPVAVQALYSSATEQVFSFEEEQEVDDIPFDTYEIVNRPRVTVTPVFFPILDAELEF